MTNKSIGTMPVKLYAQALKMKKPVHIATVHVDVLVDEVSDDGKVHVDSEATIGQLTVALARGFGGFDDEVTS